MTSPTMNGISQRKEETAEMSDLHESDDKTKFTDQKLEDTFTHVTPLFARTSAMQASTIKSLDDTNETLDHVESLDTDSEIPNKTPRERLYKTISSDASLTNKTDGLKQRINLDDKNSSTTTSSQKRQTDESQKQLRKRVILILIIVNITSFIASFSYWIQSGVLPYLTRKLGVTPELYGLLESTFALYQLLGSPIFGRCGDVFGNRIIMIVSEIASAVNYATLAFSSTIWMLFLARVPAFFMHNLQGSYMIITDVTTSKERADMLGKLGVSHGLGMIVGSFVGGIVTHVFSEEIAALVAACGNLVSVIIIFIFIPNDTKAIRRSLENIDIENNEQVTGKLTFGVKELLLVLKIRNVGYLLFIKVVAGFPYSLLYSMFTIAVMDYYNLGPRENGIILAYIGVIGIFTQGILIGVLTKHYAFPVLINSALYLNAATFLFLVVADNVIILCILILPLAIAGTVLHIVLTTAITKVVPIEDTGSALGLSSAISALVRSVAPTVGGLIFVNIGWPFFGFIGYFVYLILGLHVILYPRNDY